MQPRKILQWSVRWHVPFLLLILFLAVQSLSTFGTFVVSDDLTWVQRTAADSHRPWNAFGKPVFGDYYRPIPNLIWQMNYGLWGFDFDGHQLMFIVMWLAGVCLVYALGCRLGGRIAGFAAAALVGLNDIYLVIESWKSWYTTLTEFVVVLAWALCFMKWVESRRRGFLIASAALAVVGLLSRELAPLIISAVVLVTVILPAFKTSAVSGRRATAWLIAWFVVTVAALSVLPSYRNSTLAALGHVQRALSPVSHATSAVVDGNGGAGARVWERFVLHAGGIFNYGLSRYLLLFAALFAVLRARREKPALARRYRLVLLGAFVLGAVVVGFAPAVDAHLYGGRVVRGQQGIVVFGPEKIDDRVGWRLVGKQNAGAAFDRYHINKDAQGVVVENVLPDGPADKAGVRVGDLIRAAGGTPTADGDNLRAVVAATLPGTAFEITIVREGREMKVRIAILEYVKPAIDAVLMLLFCIVALAGDRWDRMLGAWFVVSFVPVLFLEHISGAYHLLAFAALALYAARGCSAYVEEELLPAVARLRGLAPARADDDARYLAAGIFIVLLCSQAWMLGTNVPLVRAEIERRVKHGKIMEAHVQRAVEGALRNAGSDHRVWIAPEPYAQLAGLILQEEHGFHPEPLDRSSPHGLRPLDDVVGVFVMR